MVAAGDFKNGITVEIDGNIYQILELSSVCKNKAEKYYQRRCG